jgi:hypothetical protein
MILVALALGTGPMRCLVSEPGTRLHRRQDHFYPELFSERNDRLLPRPLYVFAVRIESRDRLRTQLE